MAAAAAAWGLHGGFRRLLRRLFRFIETQVAAAAAADAAAAWKVADPLLLPAGDHPDADAAVAAARRCSPPSSPHRLLYAPAPTTPRAHPRPGSRLHPPTGGRLLPAPTGAPRHRPGPEARHRRRQDRSHSLAWGLTPPCPPSPLASARVGADAPLPPSLARVRSLGADAPLPPIPDCPLHPPGQLPIRHSQYTKSSTFLRCRHPLFTPLHPLPVVCVDRQGIPDVVGFLGHSPGSHQTN